MILIINELKKIPNRIITDSKIAIKVLSKWKSH